MQRNEPIQGPYIQEHLFVKWTLCLNVTIIIIIVIIVIIIISVIVFVIIIITSILSYFGL